MGPMGVETLQKACQENMVNFKSNAERVYLNWMQTSARTQVPDALVNDNLAVSK